MTVRVRFAPAPTGFPHVGNLRTALFNWLFARHHGGSLVLRIEDTDVDRRVPGSLEAIFEGLQWLGLDWDEGPGKGGDYGPYVQSERLSIYQPIAERLVAEGKAYTCYCSPERLDAMRREQTQQKLPPRYDRRCRDLSEAAKVQPGTEPVVRFKTPLEGKTAFDDQVRGQVEFENSSLDDFVLLKSDGYPTYHLANVIDDHGMAISHVLRADEWLSSTPRHVLLYQALGWEPAQFAHLPMILGPDRSKLSKRHGAASVLEYRELGYLPEALLNFMALLGWSLDDRTEVLDRDELIRHFSIERIGKTGAIFNREKLDWMNGVYLRKLSSQALADRLLPFLERDLPPDVARPLSQGQVLKAVPLVQDRLRTLAEGASLTDFFFRKDLAYDVAMLKKPVPDGAKARMALGRALAELNDLPDWDAPSLEGVLRPMASDLGLKTGEFFGLLRVATTARTVAPPLFETMAALGRERCLPRLHAALALLDSNSG